MDQKEFLARVLPAGNHYIAYPGDVKDGRLIWYHRSFVEPYQGVQFADQTADRSKDVYFAVASFKEAQVMDPRLGKMKSCRKQENVAELKCLFLDIDFKNYDSPEETVNALKSFLELSHLERPSIIVKTGGGLHVYWTFPGPLPREEWQPLANGLAGLAENLGLRADLQCTIDCARILRMPGTRNLKYDPARLCEIVSFRSEDVDMAALTQRLHGVTSIRARTGRKAPNLKVDPAVAGMFSDSDTDDLGHGLEADYTVKEMAAPGGCPMIADMLVRGGEGDSRELWNNMILLTSFATDGRQFAHALSNQDPRYTGAETDAEFDAKLAEQGKGIGPTLCDTFARCSAQCATCPHFGKIKSPIVLGKAKPKVEDASVMEPTFIEGECTWAWVHDDKGVPVKRMIFDMELDRPVLEDVLGAAQLKISLRRGGRRTRPLTLECSKLGTRDYMPSQFGGIACPIPKSRQKLVEEVLMAWTTLLRNQAADIDAAAFGWAHGETPRTSGFALCGSFYAADGEVYKVGDPGKNTTANYGISGTPDTWNALANVALADPRVEMQVLLATAFAAPLLEFTELSATAIVVRSPNSGVGKTSFMKVARAVYGDPEDMAQASDTAMSVESRLAALTNLPWYWDELKVADPVATANTLYQVLQGRSKARGRPDGGLRETHHTRGMLVMATNISMTGIMQEASRGSDAGGYRVLELTVPPRANRSSSDSFSQLMAKLRRNYGHAGAAYARYLGTHQAELEKAMASISGLVDRDCGSLEVERYWLTTIKALLVGAAAAKAAGICAFDVPKMFSFLKETLERNRASSLTNNSPTDMAGRIWRYFPHRSLITDEFQFSGPGVPKQVKDAVPIVHQTGTPRVRLAYRTNVLLISKEGVKEFCAYHRYNEELLYSQMRELGRLERTSIDKGVATAIGSKTGREWLFVLKATDILGDEEVNRWVTSAASPSGATPGSSSGSAPSGSTAP